ncbi:MAG: GspH/FimT family pseudopilin [Lentisphaerae bacterium]|nr:GspH/FimT family pseudopilin [Lentisphaerota bacterium]
MRRTGFTLLELLTVMAIMGIIMASGAAAFFGMGTGSRMRGTVNNLRSAISLARQQAVLKGQPLALRFEEQAGRYCYFVTNAVEGYAVGEERFMPAGVEFVSPPTPAFPFSMTFQPRGGTAGGGTTTLRIRDTTGSDTRTLTVYGLTGLVRVN